MRVRAKGTRSRSACCRGCGNFFRSDLLMEVFCMFRGSGLHLRAPPRCTSPRLHALRSISWQFWRSPSRPCSAFCRAPSDPCCSSIPFPSLYSPTLSPSSRKLLSLSLPPSLPLLIPLNVAFPPFPSSSLSLPFLLPTETERVTDVSNRVGVKIWRESMRCRIHQLPINKTNA